MVNTRYIPDASGAPPARAENTRLWVVRHAPTAELGVCRGQSDPPLTIDPANAAEQVLAHLEQRAAPRFDVVFASPWRRALAPAAYVAERLGVALSIDPRLSELSFGDWEGRTYAWVEQNDGDQFARWMSDYMHLAPPGGETTRALVDRVAAWAFEAMEPPVHVLAFTHAGPIRALRALARGLDYCGVALEPVSHLVPEPIAIDKARRFWF